LEFYKGAIAGYEIHMGRTHFSAGAIKKKKGLAMYKKGDKRGGIDWDIKYNKLADVMRINSDMKKVYEILNCT